MATDTLETIMPATPVRSRRALLTAALGGLGGLFASRLAGPGPAAAAAGDPLIIGNTTNTAGTANTTLTTASAGTALLVTQNGSGAALRGSAVGPGSIAGFFTAANGTGISGVTANPNSYGVFGSNDAAGGGTGGAVRADGNVNNGLVASTDNSGSYAVKAVNNGLGDAVRAQSTGGHGVHSSSSSGPGVYSSSDSSDGVHGQSISGNGVRGSSGSGIGVRGSSGSGIGMHGSSDHNVAVLGTSLSSIGVYGQSSSSTAVYGASNSGRGVHGSSSNNYGVHGSSAGNNGVFGESFNGVGVYGYTVNADASAGYFEGLLTANTVSASIKNFRIDHPVDPAGKVLAHSCVESNERLTVYAGTVTTDAAGEATINLPGYFEALNRDLRYQLTVIGSFAQAMVKREVKGNRFTIATSEPTTKVCWQVSGARQDVYAKAHPLVVESAKTGKEKGRYLNPIEHGQPESKGVAHELRQAGRGAAAPRG